MDKKFYDKYSKEFHCADCVFLDNCIKNSEPLYGKCCEQYLRDRVAELEEQLKNAIVPKFKVGQEVYIADTYFDKVYVLKISSISIFRREHYNHISYDGHLEESLFATKEEAQAKFKEMKNEQANY